MCRFGFHDPLYHRFGRQDAAAALREDFFDDAGGEDAGEAVVEALVFVGEAEVIDA
jgi:hypothetical protein